MEEGGTDKASLSIQEQEMLTYLEDLQANNPAEYELLVQQLQEGKAGQGGAKAEHKGEQVTPTPGFVAKTRSATNQGAKVFINICQSEHVDRPAPVTSAETSEEVQMRIPMSLGPPREDLDKSGDVCTVYDVVFHPDAVEGSLTDEEFRSFVMQLTLHQIKEKHKDELSMDITFPKVKGNYKGIAPLPQYMRKKGTPPPPPPGQESEGAEGGASGDDTAAAEGGVGGKKPLVEEMAEPSVETLAAPSYSVEPRHLRGSSAGGGEPDGLSVKAHLPGVMDASAIELQVNQDTLELVVPSVCALTLQLPVQVATPPLSCRFEAQRCILSVIFRTDTANALEGSIHATTSKSDGETGGVGKTEAANIEAGGGREEGGEKDEWQARLLRESEARQNARRKRAAGNKHMEAKRAADEAAAAQPQEADEATGGAGGEADGTDGRGVDSDAGGSESVVQGGGGSGGGGSSREPSGVAGLSNSIIFELED